MEVGIKTEVVMNIKIRETFDYIINKVSTEPVIVTHQDDMVILLFQGTRCVIDKSSCSISLATVLSGTHVAMVVAQDEFEDLEFNNYLNRLIGHISAKFSSDIEMVTNLIKAGY